VSQSSNYSINYNNNTLLNETHYYNKTKMKHVIIKINTANKDIHSTD